MAGHGAGIRVFALFNLIGPFVIGLLEAAAGRGGSIGAIDSIEPGIAMDARRMHDTGRSGWWLLLPVGSIVLLAPEGQRGSNQCGDDPM